MRFTRTAVAAIALGVGQSAAGAAQSAPDAGGAPYMKWCSGCHGDTGAGDGYAAMRLLPRPRDFTLGVFKIRTTPSGEQPTDADLAHVIDEGLNGSPMVGWKTKLTTQERADIVRYIKGLSPFFDGPVPQSIVIGEPPPDDPTGIAEGRRVYEQLKCFECHGQAGRGDGTSVPTFTSDDGFPIPASDLTEGWRFKGGTSVRDVYTRLRTGLDGTPMPSYGEQVEAGLITDEQLWQLAQYVRSLSPEVPPSFSDVIRTQLVESLPLAPGDAAWTAIDSAYVPLAGQVVVPPRWFTPSVDGLWIHAAHDGESVAIKVTWHEPSESPDPAFDPWLESMRQTVDGVDEPFPRAQGPDRLTVVYPQQLGADSLRPYFVSGDSRRAAYVWRWSSTSETIHEGAARGLLRFAPRSDAEVDHAARYEHGRWQVQFSRALTPSDTTVALGFTAGDRIPISFFVADGSNGEVGARGAVSGWRNLLLEAP